MYCAQELIVKRNLSVDTDAPLIDLVNEDLNSLRDVGSKVSPSPPKVNYDDKMITHSLMDISVHNSKVIFPRLTPQRRRVPIKHSLKSVATHTTWDLQEERCCPRQSNPDHSLLVGVSG